MSEKCKVLIVDDELIIRQGIRYMLDWESYGYVLLDCVSNGQEAVSAIQKEKPDIVISDICMPVMDGMALAKWIHETCPEIKMIVLSSFSDFEYVRSSFQNGVVDYILKPTLSPEELLKALKKVSQNRFPADTENPILQTQKALERYFTSFEDTLPECLLNKAHPWYMAWVPREFAETFAASSFRDSFLADSLYVLNLNDPFYFLLFESAADIYTIQRELEPWIPQGGYLVLSSPCTSPFQLKKQMESQKRELLQSRFYCEDEKVTVWKPEMARAAHMPFPLDKYIESINRSDFTRAFAILKTYVHEALEKKVQEEELKSAVSNAIYHFINVLSEVTTSGEHIAHFKLNCLNVMQKSRYARDFEREVGFILSDFETLVSSYQSLQKRSEVQQMMDYIETHFHQPLQLQDLAARFGFSYSYASSLFSSGSSQTFVEYLNHIRVQKSCSLLANKELSVAQVAFQVGYGDSGYFSRIFKKEMGMSPKEYRKQIMGASV